MKKNANIDFEKVFKSAPNLYLLLDAHYTIVEVNDAYLSATKTERENILNKHIFEVFPDNPHDLAATGVQNLRASLDCVRDTHMVHHMPIQKYDIPLPQIEGGGFEERYWSPVNTPVLGEDGSLQYIIHRVEDVTEFMKLKHQKTQLTRELAVKEEKMVAEIYNRQKEIETTKVQLETSLERYKILTSTVPVGVVHTNPEGLCAYVNPYWQQLTGEQWQDIRNKPWYEHIVQEDAIRVKQEWESHTHKGGFLFKSEFRFTLPSGENKWLQAQISPELDFKGGITGYVGSFIDITDHKQQEATERQRAEMLAELDRAKTLFFSNISHELRTPLTLILGPLDELLKDNSSLLEAYQPQLNLIYRNALRLLKLVNVLLDFSRIEANKMQATYEATDLGTLTEDLISMFRSAIEKANLDLNVDISHLNECVYVDKEMYEKIIFNLISNALKFTKHGSISISLSKKTSQVELCVADTGIGIPEKECPHIFERFYRVEGNRGRSYEGSGIGLALTEELVKLHGGHITVHSKEGEGSQFIVQFPLGFAHLPPERLGQQKEYEPGKLGKVYALEAVQWAPCENQAPPSGSQEEIPTPSSFTPRQKRERILVADDNADMRQYIKHLLEPYWQVETVSDGEQALAATLSNPPDLILCDVMMPGLDGLGFLQKIRANLDTKLIPIMLLSARSGEEARVEGLQLGADDYIVKPFSAPELLARIKTHLASGQLRRHLLMEVNTQAKELLKRAVEAEENKKKLAAYIDTICHGILNPLTGIKGNNEFALLDVKNLFRFVEGSSSFLMPEQRESLQSLITKLSGYLTAMEECVHHAKRIVDDTLLLSQLDTDEAKLTITPIRLHSLIQSLIKRFKDQLEKKNLILILQACSEDIWVKGDKKQLKKILINLLSNAIKFTDQGEIIFSVRVTLLETTSIQLQFTVSDTGTGMPPEQVNKLFSQAKSAHRKVAYHYSGSGFGLTLCEKLVELMGGSISVQSQLGQGSRFVFAIPSSLLTPQEIKELNPPEQHACRFLEDTSIKKESSEEESRQPIAILIVEDNRLNQRVLSKLITDKGCRFKIAQNGKEAIERWKEEVFDLIFMDIEMPEMDGLEATTVIRRQESFGVSNNFFTPIVGLTGDARDEQKQAGLAAGMNEYMVKPYVREKIYKLIDKWAGVHKQEEDQSTSADTFNISRLSTFESSRILYKPQSLFFTSAQNVSSEVPKLINAKTKNIP